jgi:hypothetical protein
MTDLPTVTQTTPVERLWGIVLDLEDWSKELDALRLDKMARYALDKAMEVRESSAGVREYVDGLLWKIDDLNAQIDGFKSRSVAERLGLTSPLSQLTEGATDGNAQPV